MEQSQTVTANSHWPRLVLYQAHRDTRASQRDYMTISARSNCASFTCALQCSRGTDESRMGTILQIITVWSIGTTVHVHCGRIKSDLFLEKIDYGPFQNIHSFA